jgi:uncharacterized membrane protein SpoIIM required for sporulation
LVIFNGYLLGTAINPILLLSTEEAKYLILLLFPHLPTEILAFCWFGSFGLSGFQIIIDSYGKNDISVSLPQFKVLLFPFFILFISALIEAYVIFSNHAK